MFFITHFLYFIIFNRYHLAYQEQMQLFRFDWNYFTSFLTKPGGISEYSGAFLTQFFLSPIIGAFIVTLAGIAAYALSKYIFRKYRIFGILWSFIPVLLLVALQSFYKYKLDYTIGFLLTLMFIAIYVSLRKESLRYATGFIGWFLLYLATGGFSLLASVLCIIYELLFIKKPYHYFVALGFALMTILLPYLAWRYIYFISISDAWLNLILFLFPYKGITKYGLLLLLAYYPLLLIGIKIWLTLSKKTQFTFNWNWKTMLAGIIVFSAITVWIKKNAYDYKTELLLAIDENVQQKNWDQVLKLSSRYPENHLLVLYFTNLALYKSGQLGDRMFHYNQVGPYGLSFKWTTNHYTPFFGGEVFYHLGYINETYRLAFDAMVIDGISPRLLKRLILTSIINGKYEVAYKYLKILDQSLFYRKWAHHYQNYLVNPELLIQDPEISRKRHFLIHTDFFAGEDSTVLGLTKLLENHPDNKMAFEYYMASLLLSKKIIAFADNIDRIKDFGYKEIPVHYEEALLWYLGYSNKSIIPDGYTIKKSTIQRFNDYVDAYSSYSGNPILMAEALNKQFGNTYWFYYHFNNIQVSPQ